jgi:Protein of unknown function (DUF692)
MSIARPNLGHGVGLRPKHFGRLLNEPPRVAWMEVTSENFMAPGGRPLAVLERVRREVPVVLPEADRDILRCDADDRGDLRMREAFERQGEHLALAERQRAQVAKELLGALTRRHLLVGSGPRIGDVGRLLIRWQPFPAAPCMREHAVVRDAQDERPRRAFPAKTAQRLPDGDEDVLGEIVALGAGRRVAGNHPPEGGPVVLEEVVERHAP